MPLVGKICSIRGIHTYAFLLLLFLLFLFLFLLFLPLLFVINFSWLFLLSFLLVLEETKTTNLEFLTFSYLAAQTMRLNIHVDACVGSISACILY